MVYKRFWMEYLRGTRAYTNAWYENKCGKTVMLGNVLQSDGRDHAQRCVFFLVTMLHVIVLKKHNLLNSGMIIDRTLDLYFLFCAFALAILR
jgi:hypothetical protein